tara:strand:- start:3306 stop:3971 length:666 start_codon:yes stop_codon:yes gene_type:complete
MFEHKKMMFEELNTESIGGNRHYITPNGAYPSITTVLGVLSKQGIAEWRARVGEEVANRISTQAARRGTNVHQMCEDYVNNELDKTKFLPHEKAMFNSIKKVLDESLGLVYAQECPLYSDYLGIAGRVDCVAEYNGRLSIIDYKTSGKMKKKEWIGNYFQQASAYCVMFEERTKIPVDQIVIVVAVENEDKAQVFVEKRDNYIGECIKTMEKYKESLNVDE